MGILWVLDLLRIGKRELVALLCLPGVSWLLCGSSSRWHGFVCSLWLWYFLIILTYYFCPFLFCNHRIGKRELLALLWFSSWRHVVSGFLWLFFTVLCSGLQFVIVAFYYHTHLLFILFYCFWSIFRPACRQEYIIEFTFWARRFLLAPKTLFKFMSLKISTKLSSKYFLMWPYAFLFNTCSFYIDYFIICLPFCLYYCCLYNLKDSKYYI